MLFLKSLLFIVLNVGFGLLLVWLVKWFLFNPRQKKIFGFTNPLTPGFLVRKRDWVFNKARDLLQDYLEQADDPRRSSGYLFKLEEDLREWTWEQMSFVDNWPLLPRGLKAKIRDLIASGARSLAAKLLRKTVHHLVQQWRIEHRIDDFDEKFDLEFFTKYYNQYLHKPVLKVVGAINLVLGILNMVMFLVLA